MKRPVWRYYAGLFRSDWRRWLLSLLLSVMQAVAVFPLVYVVKYAFDVVLPSGDTTMLLVTGGVMLVSKLALSGLVIATRRLNVELVKEVSLRMRSDLLWHMYALPRAFHSKAEQGRLHAILEQDSDRVDAMSAALGAQLVPALAISAGFAVILLQINPPLFVVLLAFAPLLLWAARAMKAQVVAANRAYRGADLVYSQGLLAVLQRMDLTRFQTAESYETALRGRELAELRRTSTRLGWLNTAYVEMQSSLISLAAIAILVVGGLTVAAQTMTMGSLVAFYVVVGSMAAYVSQIWSSISPISAGTESLHALYALLEQTDEQAYRGSKRLEDFSGDVSVESVSFRYGETPVLREVSLRLRPHTITGLTGPNGAGKSTLIWLLLGLYRPEGGNVCADGIPYDQIDVAALRRRFGVVPQSLFLFDGTIWENLTYGLPEATPARVDRACDLATAAEFISELPEGYGTRVGEHGMLLSGGQRQRLALARALVREPRLLILDEPTNHLDRAAIEQLMANLDGLAPKPAVLLVTHDASLLAHADAVYTLANGRLSRAS